MTRADVILLLLGLSAAAVFAFCMAVGRREGTTLRLTCDGKVVGRSSLPESWRDDTEAAKEKVRYCLLLYTETGVSCKWYAAKPDLAPVVSEEISYNLLTVSASGVSMEAADCPDQICVHHIPISGDGESIICLPHKLVAEIRGGEAWFPTENASEGRRP